MIPDGDTRSIGGRRFAAGIKRGAGRAASDEAGRAPDSKKAAAHGDWFRSLSVDGIRVCHARPTSSHHHRHRRSLPPEPLPSLPPFPASHLCPPPFSRLGPSPVSPVFPLFWFRIAAPAPIPPDCTSCALPPRPGLGNSGVSGDLERGGVVGLLHSSLPNPRFLFFIASGFRVVDEIFAASAVFRRFCRVCGIFLSLVGRNWRWWSGVGSRLRIRRVFGVGLGPMSRFMSEK